MPNNLCSNILRPLQIRGVCWFMALIVVIFYSQRSRKVIIDESSRWDDFVQSLFSKILYNKYIIDKKFHMLPADEYKHFSDNIFIDILGKLNRKDRKHFVVDPEIHDIDEGFYSEIYIGRLYTLLGIDYKMFDFNPWNRNKLTYSHFNKEYDDMRTMIYIKPRRVIMLYNNDTPIIPLYEDNGVAPKILIIRVSPYWTDINKFKNNNIYYTNKLYPLCRMVEEKIYNGRKYNLDSVILRNYNTIEKNHIIVGMTCKKNRYIYNGHPKSLTKQYPCKLIKYDWNIYQDKDFYLKDDDCNMHDTSSIPDDKCYNFSKGPRILIYVRKDEHNTSGSNDKDITNYEEFLMQRRRIARIRRIEEEKMRISDEQKDQKRKHHDSESSEIKKLTNRIEGLTLKGPPTLKSPPKKKNRNIQIEFRLPK